MKKESIKKIRRESVGIPGIDNMVEGGLPIGGVIGLSGPAGVGKSIISIHFILEGARKGQKSVYVNLEEPLSNIKNMINQFSFAAEFFELQRKGLIVIKCFDYDEYEQIYNDLFDRFAEDKSIKRLVIDSFNCFFDSISHACPPENPVNVRMVINESFHKLRRLGLTTLLTLEKASIGEERYTGYNIPYLVDGLIQLDFLNFGLIERIVFIPKMRWTSQYKESKSYEISEAGISVEEESLGVV